MAELIPSGRVPDGAMLRHQPPPADGPQGAKSSAEETIPDLYSGRGLARVINWGEKGCL